MYDPCDGGDQWHAEHDWYDEHVVESAYKQDIEQKTEAQSQPQQWYEQQYKKGYNISYRSSLMSLECKLNELE